MSDMFFTKRGDTSPAIKRQLTDGDGNPLPLEGATVRFSMARNGVVVVDRRECLAEADGWAVYQWQPGDTDAAGMHQAEFEITYPGGGVESAPNDGFIFINIAEDIA